MGTGYGCARPTSQARQRIGGRARAWPTSTRRGRRAPLSAPTRSWSRASSIALGRAGIGIRALIPQQATLEQLFFQLTEGDGGPGGGRRRRPTRSSRRWRDARPSSPLYRWELRKLVSQKRTYLGLGAAAVVPIIFVVALPCRAARPTTSPSAATCASPAWPSRSCCCCSASIWLFPLITALVAGDIIASEDHNGTLKTILTRSLDRGQVFAGKLLAAATYAALALVADGRGGGGRGQHRVGLQPAHRPVRAAGLGRARRSALVAASFAVYLMPIAAVVCIGLLLSALTRNSAAAVVGHADVRAADAADRHPAGALGHRPVPADDAVPGLAGLLPDADRLGRRSSARCGCARSTPYRPGSAPTWCSCGATSPAAERATTGSDPDVASVGFGCGS